MMEVYANDHCVIFIENYSIMTINFTVVLIFIMFNLSHYSVVIN